MEIMVLTVVVVVLVMQFHLWFLRLKQSRLSRWLGKKLVKLLMRMAYRIHLLEHSDGR